MLLRTTRQRNCLGRVLANLPLNQPHIRRIDCPGLRPHRLALHRAQQVPVGLLQPLRLLGSPALRPDLRDTLNGFIRDRDCLIPRILQYITIPWIIKTILPPVTTLSLLVSLIPRRLVPEKGLKPAGNRIAQGLPVQDSPNT